MIFNQHGFNLIGKYFLDTKGNICQTTEIGIKKSKRVSLVYVMLVNNECMYIGKTIQGFTRPLSYHKNSVMKDVLSGISTELQSDNEVKVYARLFNEKLVYEDLELDICEAFEQALISKYKPRWNNHIRPAL